MSSHPNNSVSSVEPAEVAGNSLPGLPFDPLKVKIEPHPPIQTTSVEKEFGNSFRRMIQMEDSIGDVKVPGRLRAISYSCEPRRGSVIGARFASSNTVCVWNDQTGQSVVVGSNQSTRDALASLSQRDSEVERKQTAARIAIKKAEERTKQEKEFMTIHRKILEEEQPQNRPRSQSVSIKPKKITRKVHNYIDASNITEDDAQAMIYTYMSYTSQSEFSTLVQKDCHQVEPLLEKVHNSTASSSTSLSSSLNITPESAPSTSLTMESSTSNELLTHVEPVKLDNRKHFGMSRFLDEDPPKQSIATSSNPALDVQTNIDPSRPSAVLNRSLSCSMDQTRNGMEEGANPSTVDHLKVFTPANVSPNETFSFLPISAGSQDNVDNRPIKIEPDEEVAELLRQKSVEILPNSTISPTARCKSTPVDLAHEALIAFIKGPLELAKALEQAALRRKLTEPKLKPKPKPKRKPRPKAAVSRSIHSDSNAVQTVKKRTAVASRADTKKFSQLIANNSNRQMPAERTYDKLQANYVDTSLLNNYPSDSLPVTGPSVRKFIRLDMPLGQALQEVPLGAVAGQLEVQKILYGKMDGFNGVPIESASTEQNLTGDTAPKPVKKPSAPKKKKPTKAEIEAAAREAGQPIVEKPKAKRAPAKKKQVEQAPMVPVEQLQDQFIFQQPVPQPTVPALPSVANLLPSVANLLPRLNKQKNEPQQKHNGGMHNNTMNSYGYADGASGASSSSSSTYYTSQKATKPREQQKSLASMLTPLGGGPMDQQVNMGASSSQQMYNNQQYTQQSTEFTGETYQQVPVYKSSATIYFGGYEAPQQYQSFEYPQHSVESHNSSNSRDSNAQNSHSSMPQTPISQQVNHGSQFDMPVQNVQTSQSNEPMKQQSISPDFDAEEFANQYGIMNTRTSVSPVNVFTPGLSEITVDDFFESMAGDTARSGTSTPTDFFNEQGSSGPPSNTVRQEHFKDDNQRDTHSAPVNTQFQPVQATIVSNRVMKSASSDGQSYANVQYVPTDHNTLSNNHQSYQNHQSHPNRQTSSNAASNCFQKPDGNSMSRPEVQYSGSHYTNANQNAKQQHQTPPTSVPPPNIAMEQPSDHILFIPDPGQNLPPPYDQPICFVQYVPDSVSQTNLKEPNGWKKKMSESNEPSIQEQYAALPAQKPKRIASATRKRRQSYLLDTVQPMPPHVDANAPVGEVLKNHATLLAKKESSPGRRFEYAPSTMMLSPAKQYTFIEKPSNEPPEDFLEPAKDDVVEDSIDTVIAAVIRSPSKEPAVGKPQEVLSAQTSVNPSEETIAVVTAQESKTEHMKSPNVKQPTSTLQQMLASPPKLILTNSSASYIQRTINPTLRRPYNRQPDVPINNGQVVQNGQSQAMQQQFQQNARIDYVPSLQNGQEQHQQQVQRPNQPHLVQPNPIKKSRARYTNKQPQNHMQFQQSQDLQTQNSQVGNQSYPNQGQQHVNIQHVQHQSMPQQQMNMQQATSSAPHLEALLKSKPVMVNQQPNRPHMNLEKMLSTAQPERPTLNLEKMMQHPESQRSSQQIVCSPQKQPDHGIEMQRQNMQIQKNDQMQQHQARSQYQQQAPVPQNQQMMNQPMSNQQMHNQQMQNHRMAHQQMPNQPNQRMQTHQMQRQQSQNMLIQTGHMHNSQMVNGQSQLHNGHMQNGHMQNNHMQNNQMQNGHMQNGHMQNNHMQNNQMQNNQMQNNQMQNGQMQNGQMSNGKLQNGTMQNGQVQYSQEQKNHQQQPNQQAPVQQVHIRHVEIQQPLNHHMQSQQGQYAQVQYSQQPQTDSSQQFFPPTTTGKVRKPRIRKSRAKPKIGPQAVPNSATIQRSVSGASIETVGAPQRAQNAMPHCPLLQAQLSKPIVTQVRFDDVPEQRMHQQQFQVQQEQGVHMDNPSHTIQNQRPESFETAPKSAPKPISQPPKRQTTPPISKQNKGSSKQKEEEEQMKILQIIKEKLAVENQQALQQAPESEKIITLPINVVARARRIREVIKGIAELPSFTEDEFFEDERLPKFYSFEEFKTFVTKQMIEDPCLAEIGVEDVLAQPELEPALHGRFRKRLNAIREGRTRNTTFKKRKLHPSEIAAAAAKRAKMQQKNHADYAVVSEPLSSENSMPEQPSSNEASSEPIPSLTEDDSKSAFPSDTDSMHSAICNSPPPQPVVETLNSQSTTTNYDNSVPKNPNMSLLPPVTDITLTHENVLLNDNDPFIGHQSSDFDDSDDFPTVNLNSSSHSESPSKGILEEYSTVDASYLLNASPYPELELHGDVSLNNINGDRAMSPDFFDPRHSPSAFDSVVFNESTQDFDPIAEPTTFGIDNDDHVDQFVQEYKTVTGISISPDLFKNDHEISNGQSSSSDPFLDKYDNADGQCSSNDLAAKEFEIGGQQSSSNNAITQEFDLVNQKTEAASVLCNGNNSTVLDEMTPSQPSEVSIISSEIKLKRINYKNIAKFHSPEVGSNAIKDERKPSFLPVKKSRSTQQRQKAAFARQVRAVKAQMAADVAVGEILEKLKDEPAFLMMRYGTTKNPKALVVESNLPNNATEQSVDTSPQNVGIQVTVQPNKVHQCMIIFQNRMTSH